MKRNNALRRIIFLTSLFISFSSTNAQEKLPDGNNYKLPPFSERAVIGIWLKSKYCSRSFEKIKNKVFDVTRCNDGSGDYSKDDEGGDKGKLISQLSPNKFQANNSRNKDHYVILPDGNLSVRDKQGEIDVEKKFDGKWASSNYSRNAPSVVEDKRTLKLKCYDIGYTYGFVAHKSYKGIKTNPDWNFEIPYRCKNAIETNSGMQEGIKAAQR